LPRDSSGQTDRTTQDIYISFDLARKVVKVENNLCDDYFSDLRKASRYRPTDNPADIPVIHPIFIPSKLRGRQGETEDVEVVVPQLYTDQLEDFPKTFVIPVVDSSEAERYRDHISKRSISVKFMMVIDDSNSEFPINIGRKRHLIKIFAEQVLKLDRYWVIDDDIAIFIEMVELLRRAPCSIGRALHYAQRVLQKELEIEGYESKAEELLKQIYETGQYQLSLFNFIAPYLSQNSMSTYHAAIVNDPEGFEKLCNEAGLLDKLQDIQKDRLLRVGQVALYNRIDRSSEKRDLLIMKGNFSHINRGARYQVVLFNRVAMEGIEYMSKEEFFQTSRCPFFSCTAFSISPNFSFFKAHLR
jgi:hypothetical protein